MTAGLSLPPAADSYGHGLPKVYSIHRTTTRLGDRVFAAAGQRCATVSITDLRQHNLFLGRLPTGAKDTFVVLLIAAMFSDLFLA